jgi:hypothetical protein
LIFNGCEAWLLAAGSGAIVAGRYAGAALGLSELRLVGLGVKQCAAGEGQHRCQCGLFCQFVCFLPSERFL